MATTMAFRNSKIMKSIQRSATLLLKDNPTTLLMEKIEKGKKVKDNISFRSRGESDARGGGDIGVLQREVLGTACFGHFTYEKNKLDTPNKTTAAKNLEIPVNNWFSQRVGKGGGE